MKYLKIQNTGELDIRLVALMGGTKNNLDFKIFIGENEVKITTETEKKILTQKVK